MNSALTQIILFLLFPAISFSQASSTDTVYYKGEGRKVQQIIKKSGNRKEISYYYENGAVKAQENYLNNKLEGIVKRWYLNGERQEESIFQSGLPVKKRLWYSNGFLDREENYKIIKKDTSRVSVLDGKYINSSESGHPLTEGFYKNNNKEGKWTEYYENGKKKSVQSFKNNLKSGRSEYWYKSGKRSYIGNSIIQIKNNRPQELLHGKQKKYFENGNKQEVSNYKFGKKDGLYEEWFENGNKKSFVEYKDDYVHGKNLQWFSNGNLKQEFSVYHVYDSIKKYNIPFYDGKYIIYYDNGNLKTKGNYNRGKQNGLFENYYESSQLASLITFKNGLKSGQSKMWHPNGSLSQVEHFSIINENDSIKSVHVDLFERYSDKGVLVEKGIYKNGKKDGLWTQWYLNGIKAEETVYCNDLKCGKHTQWHKEGNLKQEANFKIITNEKGVEESALIDKEKDYNGKGNLVKVNYYNNKFCYKTEEFHENGKLKSVSTYILPSQYGYPTTGRRMTFFTNGQLQSDIFYYNGSSIGRHLNYYKNGNLKAIKDISGRGNNKVGYDFEWLSNGVAGSSRRYSNYNTFEEINDASLVSSLFQSYTAQPRSYPDSSGVKNGYYVSFFEFGQMQYEENYRDDKLHGLFTAYYPDNKLMYQVKMKESIPNGHFFVMFSNGKKFQDGFYKDGERDSTWTTFFDNGNKQEQQFYEVATKQVRYRKEWYENGNRKSEVNYKNGVMHGYVADWYENGKLSHEATVVEGKNEGSNKAFYENGNPRYFYFYKNNLKQGEATDWFEDGNKNQVLHYKDGIRQGFFKSWWKNGNARAEGFFTNDKEDSTWTFYTEKGELEKRVIYKDGVVQRTPSEFSCECVDSTKSNIGYAQSLSTLVSLDEVRKMSFNFHAAIDTFYNHLFFTGLQSSGGRESSFYSFNIVAYTPMYLKVPDESGVRLNLNPCKNMYGKNTSNSFYITIEKENKAATRATLNAKYLSLEFDPLLLHQWNKNASSPFRGEKDKYIPSALLFKAKNIEYNEREHLKVNEIKDPCFPLSEIGRTGVLLEFKDVILDLDAALIPDAIDYALPFKYDELFFNVKQKGKDPREIRNSFVGIFVPEASITLPPDLFGASVEATVSGKSLMLSNEYIIGSIHLKAKLAEGLNYSVQFHKEDLRVNANDVEKAFIKKGFSRVKTEYNSATSELIIYFFYPKQ